MDDTYLKINNKYTVEEVDLLRTWSDISNKYSLLHDRACLEYEKKIIKWQSLLLL
jgi:hypothetical protein